MSIGMVVLKYLRDKNIKYWTFLPDPVTDYLKFYDNMRSYLTECKKSFLYYYHVKRVITY